MYLYSLCVYTYTYAHTFLDIARISWKTTPHLWKRTMTLGSCPDPRRNCTFSQSITRRSPGQNSLWIDHTSNAQVRILTVGDVGSSHRSFHHGSSRVRSYTSSLRPRVRKQDELPQQNLGPRNLGLGASSLHSMGSSNRSFNSNSSCQLPRKTNRSATGFAPQAAHSPCQLTGYLHWRMSRLRTVRMYTCMSYTCIHLHVYTYI